MAVEFFRSYLDGSMHAGLLNTQRNQSRYGDAIKEVVDEPHVVNEGVNVAGAQHQQSGDELHETKGDTLVKAVAGSYGQTPGLTVNNKAGMGVQRLVWIIARR